MHALTIILLSTDKKTTVLKESCRNYTHFVLISILIFAGFMNFDRMIHKLLHAICQHIACVKLYHTYVWKHKPNPLFTTDVAASVQRV